MNKYYLLLLVSSLVYTASAQHAVFTKQDSLRGSITPERAWWDLTYYQLDIVVNPDDKFISGTNTIRYKVLSKNQLLQVDLQPPLSITKIMQDGKNLTFESIGNAHFVELQKPQEIGAFNEIAVSYKGHPKIARRPPWENGLTWQKDAKGNHFVATSCQGLGASIWWPNKDHMYDEVDSMAINVTTPRELIGVANGRLRKVSEQDSTKTYHWFVKNPINNYGVNVNLGTYAHFGSEYLGENGKLDLDYYVLPYNLDKAREQFKQVPKMLEAFEHWFGPYPFYEDSFKLVEVPYLGMEHQSSITYGNQYQNGYLGRDLSGTGWGLKFDFVIIHEAGHEWFANSITYKDIADMWIHEGFTAYSENLYLDYHYGSEAAADYVIGTRRNIQNDRPIIGIYDVNQRGSNDMYYKGSNMLHTLRQLIQDDKKWRGILRGLNQEFYHKTVTTAEIESYLSKHSGVDLAAFFNQYLRSTDIPCFEYKLENGSITYRYSKVVTNFDMPLRVYINGQEEWLYPNSRWRKDRIKGNPSTFQVDRNFYIDVKKINN